MTLLAESEAGYRNLMKLASRLSRGYYYKPRMDFELLAEHSEGIIATSGCLGGLVAQLLAPDAMREEGIAKGQVRDFEAAVGGGRGSRTYSGVTTSSSRSRTTGWSRSAGDHARPSRHLVRRIGAPLLAANDAHYTRRDEARRP